MSAEYSAEFEAFWAAYPPRRPNPKAPAAAAFDRLLRRGFRAEEIREAACRYAAECAELRLDPLYIPHARTWLAQLRWRDYVGEAVKRAPAAAGEAPVDLVARELGRITFDHWIKPCRFRQEAETGRLHVTAPTRLVAEWVRTRYREALLRAFGARELIVDTERGETS